MNKIVENLPDKNSTRITDNLLEGAKACQTFIHEISAFLGIPPYPQAESQEYGPGIHGRVQHLYGLLSVNLADLRQIHEFIASL